MPYDSIVDDIKKLPEESYPELADYIEFLFFKFKGDNGSKTMKSDSVMAKQRQFVSQTAGKIRVNEQAINDLRSGSMI